MFFRLALAHHRCSGSGKRGEAALEIRLSKCCIAILLSEGRTFCFARVSKDQLRQNQFIITGNRYKIRFQSFNFCLLVKSDCEFLSLHGLVKLLTQI